MSDIYRSQVSPGGSPTMPGAPAAAFGAQIGEEAERYGARRSAIEEEAERRQRKLEEQQQLADFAVKYQEIGTQQDERLRRAKETAGPGAVGLSDEIGKAFDADWQPLLEGISNPRVLQVAREQIAAQRRRYLDEAGTFEAVSRGLKVANDVAEFQKKGYERLRLSGDVGTFGEIMVTYDLLLAGLPMSDADRGKARREGEDMFAYGTLEGMPTAQRKALLESGHFAPFLEPKTLNSLITGTEADTRREAAERERQLASLVRQQKEEEATLLVQAEQGVEIDPAEGSALAERARQRGDTSQAERIEMAIATSRVTGGVATAEQATRELAAIEADPDWREQPDKARLHKALTAKREQLRKAEPNVAAPNWDDANDVARYEREYRAEADLNGNEHPTYLTPDVLEDLKAEMAAGVQGQARVLEYIGRMSDAAAFAAARKLAPGDRVFQIASTLEGDARRLAMSGKDALAANEKAVPLASVQQLFTGRTGQALASFDADFQRSAMETTRAVAAELMRRQGKTQFDREIGEQAKRMVLGGTAQGGGEGEWNGQGVILPSRMTQREFEGRLSRFKTAAKANAYASGRQLTAAELLTQFRLVPATDGGDGRYHFVDAWGGAVLARDGTPALLNAYELPQAPQAAPRRPTLRGIEEALPGKLGPVPGYDGRNP